MADDRIKRQQTQTERDLDGLAARRERARSAPFGVPVTFDEVTGNYEGEELARMRAQRPPDMRIEHLEKKYDQLGEKVNAIHVDVAGMRGELKVLPEVLALLKGKQETAVAIAKDNNETKRLGMSNTNKVIMGVLALLTTILTGVLLGRP